MSKDFKYTTKFEIQANSILSPETVKEKEYNTKASLENLRALLPDDEKIKADTDLLYLAFNLFTANLVNKNDDGVMKEDAIAMAPNIINRYANIEHNRWDVIGHNIDYGFSTFDTNEIIPKDTIEATEEFEIFNVSAVSVVYKAVDEYFCDLLKESSDPLSMLHNEYSTSFEVGFNDYVLALGSKKLADAEILTEKHHIEEMSKYLVASGGTGFTNYGEPIYRIIKGGRMMGLGFVRRPAGSVQGLISANSSAKTIINFFKEDAAALKEFSEALFETTNEIRLNKEKEIAASKDIKEKSVTESVNTNQQQVMKIKDLKDLTESSLEAKEITAGDIRSIHNDAVNKILEQSNSEWEKKIKAEQESKEQAEAAKIQAEAKIQEQQSEIDQLRQEVSELKAQAEEVAKDNLFQERMACVNDEFDLDQKTQEVIAQQVGALDDSAEAFTKWLKDFKVLASIAKREETSTPEETASDNLETAEQETSASVPNSSSTVEFKTEGLKEALAKSMGLKS